ncbi:L,D-transpeptidase [Patescibacteria group bacterium]|nr:L,D-transpeptidase [Patescibacteria group bacterium]
MKIKYLQLTIAMLLLILPVNFLKADNKSKEIKVFDFQGNLKSSIILQNLEWDRIGDIKIADLGNDNIPEIILSAAASAKPYLKIYRLDGTLINELLVYPQNYLGGVNFEVTDLDNDGKKEIITAATSTGGPHIRILNGDGKELNSFFAFEENDRGGINVAVGNLYNDLKPEIIVSSNTHHKLRIFDNQGKLLNELELKNNFQSGQKVKVGDLGDDAVAEILTFANQEDEPFLNIYRNNGELINSFPVFSQNFKGGLNVDIDDKKILAGAGIGGGPHLKIMDSFADTLNQFFTQDKNYLGGVKLAVYNNLIYTIAELFPTAQKADDKYIEIDISEQKLRYFQNGFMLGDYLISSGKKSLPTPVGEFSIINKQKLSYSQRYNLYMPFWQSFYPGYGIHELPYWPSGYREGENHLGTPVSHGCVRLAIGPAEKLYNLTDIGTKVYIND